MITEIYVNDYKLDLYKDESILMKYTNKDLQDLSKVFSQFSQNFTIPASPKNRLAFGFFGDTDVLNVNSENKYPCKVYTNGILSLSGYLTINDLKYKNGKPTDFTTSFATTMTNLKAKIADDYLSDLMSSEVLVDVTANNMFDLTQSVQNQFVDTINFRYYTPLVSNTRVWNFDTIKFTGGTDSIKSSELRPALAISSIIDSIFKKYNLDVVMPLNSQPAYLNTYMWCNTEFITKSPSRVKLLANDPFSNPTYVEGNLADSSINIKDIGLDWFSFRLDNIQYLNSQTNKQISLQFVRKSNGLVFKEVVKDISSSQEEIIVTDLNTFFGAETNLEFYINISFNCPLIWTNNRIKVINNGLWVSETNNNNSQYNSTASINIVKALPKMKVIDFLTSFFKTFNISVFDTSPNDDRLYWLTQTDILDQYEKWGKSTVDYTKFVDISSLTKSNTADYNYYNFKHKDSSYYSNVAYKNQFQIEYGQIQYPTVKPDNAKEYKIETEFSIIPPVTVSDTSIITAYGFNQDIEPNYDEPTLFCNNGLSYLDLPIAFQKTNGTGVYTREMLLRFQLSLPYHISAEFSLSFSVLKFLETEHPYTLFANYYQSMISRLINPNVLQHDFSLRLPSTELYLNENTTFAPTGFRLQNDVVIGETLFSILEAEIDITTGKTKLKLINYAG